jgi:hypothetical protein
MQAETGIGEESGVPVVQGQSPKVEGERGHSHFGINSYTLIPKVADQDKVILEKGESAVLFAITKFN